jgi:hypothetical protein
LKVTNYPSNSVGPATSAVSITPHDTNDLDTVTRGIYVGASGDLKVDMVGGGTVIFVALVGGVIHPIQARRVYSTGTTATGIIGIW